jgi:hypothetical protein
MKKVIGKFENLNGENKDVARAFMVDNAFNTNVGLPARKGKILTLPFTEWRIEKMLLEKTKRYDFFAVEYDKPDYDKMVKNSYKYKTSDNKLISDNVIGTYNGRLEDKIACATENEYCHIFADFCGQIQTYAPTIESAIEKNIVKVGGTIAVTVANRISGNTDFHEDMQNYVPFNNKKGEDKECLHGIKTFFTMVGGKRYKIEGEPILYKDTCAMILVVVRRLK